MPGVSNNSSFGLILTHCCWRVTPAFAPIFVFDDFVSSVSENAYMPEEVAQALLDLLATGKYKAQVCEFYKTKELTLYAIAQSRNWILKADSLDTERTAKYILKDFRDGRLGKFILDELPLIENNSDSAQ